VFDFLAPGFLGKLTDFQKNYVKPIEDGDIKRLEALRARVRPFIMRRRKEDVATELPPKTEQTLYVQFGKRQLGLYNRILKAAKTEIDGAIEEARHREVADDDPRRAHAAATGLLRSAAARAARGQRCPRPPSWRRSRS
jgi:SNF2 family DNA or RNA helicase